MRMLLVCLCAMFVFLYLAGDCLDVLCVLCSVFRVLSLVFTLFFALHVICFAYIALYLCLMWAF